MWCSLLWKINKNLTPGHTPYNSGAISLGNIYLLVFFRYFVFITSIFESIETSIWFIHKLIPSWRNIKGWLFIILEYKWKQESNSIDSEFRPSWPATATSAPTGHCWQFAWVVLWDVRSAHLAISRIFHQSHRSQQSRECRTHDHSSTRTHQSDKNTFICIVPHPWKGSFWLFLFVLESALYSVTYIVLFLLWRPPYLDANYKCDMLWRRGN